MTETMQDSGIEWIGAIPRGWKLSRIKDIADLKSGDGIKAEEISPTGDYPVFGGNGLRGYTSSFTHSGYYILIGRQGALCGNINYAHETFWATEHAVVVTLIYDSFNTFWLGELLRTMNLNQYSNAAAQPGLSLDNIKFLKLPVPPIEEQQAIAHYLDERCGKLDSIIAIKKQQIQTLDTLRQSIIYQAVTKGLDGSVELVDSGVEWLGEIPKGWRLDRLKDIVSLRDEKSTEKSDAEDYLELEDLEQGTGRLLSIRNTLEVGSAVMKFYKNDVLFGKLRPYLQKYYLAKFDGKCTGEILAFKPERITPEFLLYFIATDGFIKICTAMSYSVKMPRVNYPKQLASLPVCLPKVPEQQAIADYLDQETQRLEQLKANLTQQIGVLLDYKKSLIYECVTGKKHIFKAG